MENNEIKTANTPTHNYSKSFKRYLKSRSTRSLEAILQTKRLDAGFFWMDFYPLVRDLFMARHKEYSEKEYEVLLQIHASQPFTIDDIYSSLTRKTSWNDNWLVRTTLGFRAAKSFMQKSIDNGGFVLFKKNGRYNKKMYTFSTELNNEFRRMYEHMLCLSKIRLDDPNHVPPQVRKSKPHVKKILKQNKYKDAFEADLDKKLKTSDQEFSLTLQQVRAKARRL